MEKIIDILQAVRLDSPVPFLTADENLTSVAITSAFTGFVGDISKTLRHISSGSTTTQLLLQQAFVNLAVTIRKPYLDALGAANNALSVETLRLTLANHSLKDQMVAEHKSELSNQTNAHNAERQSREKSHAKDLEKLNSERRSREKSHAKRLEKLNSEQKSRDQSHAERIEKLNSEQKSRDQSHAERIDKITYSYTTKFDQLNQKYEQLIVTNQALILNPRLGDKESVPESVNRAETWRKVVEKNPDCQDLEFPALPSTVQIHDDAISDLQETNFTDEKKMYAPVYAVLKRHLTIQSTTTTIDAGDVVYPGCTVFDTHSRKNLSGRSPDITFSIAVACDSDVTGMIGVFELKDKELDDNAHGQVYDYLKLIKHKQLQRTHFIGVISNVRQNIVMTLTREAGDNRFWCRTYKPMTLSYVISYLHELIRRPSQYLPPPPAFSIGLGTLESRLGNPSYSVVAVFPVPLGYRNRHFVKDKWMNPKTMNIEGRIVVKRTVPATHRYEERTVKDEIDLLRIIEDFGGHRNLPQILYNCLDMQELAIAPFGASLRPGTAAIAEWTTVLGGVLEALKWLHEHNIIHRDVRWDNIIWAGDRAVLIDLGASVYLPNQDKSVSEYNGGNICCPPRLIGKFDQRYTAGPADDCHAFVLLVLTLLFPKHWTNVQSVDVRRGNSVVATRLTSFWTSMRRSRVWGKYVKAAKDKNYDDLMEMLEVCVYYGSAEIIRKDDSQ